MRRIVYFVVAVGVVVAACGGGGSGTPAVPVGELTWEWSPVDLDPLVMSAGTSLQGVEWFGSDWVATGYSTPEWMIEVAGRTDPQVCWWEYRDECSTSVWTSPDGVVWTPVATLGPGSHMEVSEAGGGLGFGVRWAMDPSKGMLRPRPAVWRSSDAVNWSLVEDPALEGAAGQMFALAERPSGLVGVGFECPDPEDVDCWESLGFGDSRPAIWTSPDGLVWERVVDDPAVFLEGRLLDVAATRWGWIVVGSGIPSTGGDDEAVAYLSSDGMEWARIDLPDRSDGGLCERANAIAAFGDRAAISGKCWKLRSDGGGNRVPGVWMSDDGIEWTLIESFDGDAPRSGGSGRVTATDSGFLMVGEWGGDMRAGTTLFSVWVSPDGATWEQTTFEDPEWWTGSVCSHGDVTLAVGGYLHADDTQRARVWIGTATPK